MQPPLHRVVIEFTHDRLKEMCTNAGNFEMYDKLCDTFDNQGLKDLLDIIGAEVLDQRLDAYNEGYKNGYEAGKESGYSKGYDAGYSTAQYDNERDLA